MSTMRGFDGLTGSISLFRKFVLRDCLHNYVRTIITICGITLGVSVFLAIGLANKTALTSFYDTVDRVAGKANLEIRPLTGRTLDQSILARLTWLEMTGAAYTPIINDDVVMSVGDDRSEPIQLLAVDYFADDAFKGYEVADSDSSGESGAQLNGVFKHHGVLVGHALAAEQRLSEGDRIELAVDDRRFEVLVSGVLTDRGTGAAYGGRLLICDLSLGQEILDLPGQVSQVEIISPPQKIELLKEKLKSELPVSVTVEPPSSRTSQIEKMTRSFEYNLYALSFIALLVGMFLIYNTMAITVIRRRPELG
ncbi:MAG TPA: ABC transporter permease, partial [Candidatus Melainabacteria bacterium]|nr:ABC transporter permease [Candidatus Melainabacteria bacterium]